MFEKLTFIVITVLLVINAHFAYNSLYTRDGTVVAIETDNLTVRDSHQQHHTFRIEKETRFYNKQKNEISSQDVKVGDRVKVYFTPLAYYKALYSKGEKTARWIRKLT